MKILITGASGQLGFELLRSLAVFGQVSAPRRQDLDLSDLATVSSFLSAFCPDLIVNAAAYTAVDLAESEKEKAYQLNARLPEVLARYVEANDTWLIHYSTDYVYSGTGTALWTEDSPTAPSSVYGASKLAGDEMVMSGCKSHLIFRTSWVYGARGTNFMKTMLRLGVERSELTVVTDQTGAPTPARLLAAVTACAISKLNSFGMSSGIYHVAPRGEVSWYQFACEIFRCAEQKGEQFLIASSGLKPILTSDYPAAARRPLNSRLDVKKIERELGIVMPDWNDQLVLTLDEYLSIKK